MRLLRRQRTETPSIPAQPTHRVERFEARPVDGGVNLICTICQHVVAYAVRAERSAADDAFYLEQHAPFCQASR